MSREFSAKTLPIPVRPQQLNTVLLSPQPDPFNAMIRLARRHEKNVTHDGLRALLKGFQTFAHDYGAVLDGANSSGGLSFLLRSGIERLLQEWSILSRACEQRAETDPRYMKADDRKQSPRYYLEKADDVLAGYCRRWRHPEDDAYVPLKTPVVYFEKLYLSDYDAPERWQALAHEMGHHVFWNAVALDEFKDLQDRLREAVAKAVLARLGVTIPDAHNSHPLEEKLQNRIELWGSWLEEVVADVCGVLFAGPAFAYSAQNLAAASVNSLEDLIGASDHEHPSLYLRPLISLQVVRVLAEETPHESYRQALVNWAGAGEDETARRVPEYEDYLKAAQSADWPRGKRIPAEMPASLSGGLRWRAITSRAAVKVHPAAQTTMAELAADVPDVVREVLYAPVWPGDKCLWDLVEPYWKSQPEHTVDHYVQELETLKWDDVELILSKPEFPPLPDLPSPPETDLTRVMQRVLEEVKRSDVEESERPRIFWTLLSTLDVESDVKGYTPHDWTSDHFHDNRWREDEGHSHKHNAAGTRISWSPP